MKITTNPYFREQGYIDGLWCNAKNNDTIDVIDPATGTQLGTVPNMGTQEAIMAVDAAQKPYRNGVHSQHISAEHYCKIGLD